MKKIALWIDSLREIPNTIARFLSLLGIILLGTGFFVGIRAAAPNMVNSANHYFTQQHLQDLSIQSTYGLDEEDETILNQIEGISYLAYQSVDLEIMNTLDLIKVLPNFNEMAEINHFDIVEGRLPESGNEIALANNMRSENGNENYQIGDEISFNAASTPESDDKEPPAETGPSLTEKTFRIVGFVRSPMYIDKTTYGYTNVGKGNLDGYAVVAPATIQGNINTAIAISVDAADNHRAYTASYDQIIADKLQEIEIAFAERPDAVYQEIYATAEAEMSSARSGIESAQSELESASKQISSAQSQIIDARKELATQRSVVEQQLPAGVTLSQAGMSSIESELQAGSSSLNQASESVSSAASNYESKRTQASSTITSAETELKVAAADLNALEAPTYMINDRNALNGYGEYGDNAERIAAIARVFPLVFFLVAALVSFTTMSRMVDEQRTQIGTLKALGYRPAEIAIKFLVYSLLACLTGTAVGVLLGNYIFPTIIYYAYGLMNDLPDMISQYYWQDILIVLGISLMTTVVPALLIMRNSMRENASQLMRPRPPKQGAAIFLERFNWFWRKLGFQTKITLRNLFRYKGRNIMTLVGIAGSTALIVTGFGISDSISGLADRQFAVIQQSDLVISFNNTANEEQVSQISKYLANLENSEAYLNMSATVYQTTAETVNQQDVNINVFDETSAYQDFYALADVNTGQQYQLPVEGALVTSKLADLLSLEIGDSISLNNENGNQAEVLISGITENYILHNIYISQDYYQKAFNKEAMINQTQVKITDLPENRKDELAAELTGYEGVASVIFIEDIKTTFDSTLDTLNLVTVVLIIAAAALALIVLYSLTNINVSERIRELSTIKVLGFYPVEVSLYIYRETLIITAGGIMAGSVFGQMLTAYILETVEVDFMVFPVQVHWNSYVYAAGLTLIFSLIVMYFMHRKLKHVDMVEALKGVE